MSRDYSTWLNPKRALMWRIVHQENIPWILDNGLHCGNSGVASSTWVHIGNQELIVKRSMHRVPLGPGGYVNDYVPFYFTPFSPMMANIFKGHAGVVQRTRDEIVILVSSLPRIVKLNLPFVFTDMHAYYEWANFYTNLDDLDKIDWKMLQLRDFKRDPNDPMKFERYQAEVLIHNYCPVDALLGMVCYTDAVKTQLEGYVQQRGLSLTIATRPDWFL